ncbi:MAG: peptide ABC transporter substrate-binding protein [Phycisphaerae bacterium]|nr:peptide ABC transporter substrate-binding protein [Phycisphaerae bacterium]
MRFLLPIVVLVALLLVAVSADHPRPPADIVIGQRSDAFTLDPQRVSWQHDIRLMTGLYETLVSLDNETCKPIPGVADRWEVSDDLRTYTFHLRDNAKWSNGDPVVAGDFVYAWKRAILPDTAADYSGFLLGIEGATELFEWRTNALAEYQAAGKGSPEAAKALRDETDRRFRETVGLRAPDDRTLVVTLAQPIPYFLDLVSFGPLSPVHPATVERFTSLDPATGRLLQDHSWTKPGRIVTNGPYVVTAWRYKRDMRLDKNPHYWNKDHVAADSVEIRIIEDPNTMVLATESGAIDWVTDVLAEYRADMLEERRRYESRYASELEALRAKGLSIDDALAALPPPGPGERRNIHGLPAFGTDFYAFNCRPTLWTGESNPFADPRVRRAFSRAVDRELLVRRVTRLGEPASTVLVPPGSIDGYTSPQGLPFDIERARKELADAGWTDRDGDGFVEDANGKPFMTVDLLYSTGSPRYRGVTFALRDMWQEGLGVRVEVRAKEPKDFSTERKDGRFMIARGGWYGDYGDPTTWLDIARSTDGNNDYKYNNPRYDAMLDAAARELDPGKRLDLLTEAERFLLEEEPPVVPLCTFVTVYMYEPGRVRGLTHHPRLDQYLGQIHRATGDAAPKKSAPAATTSG